MSKSLLQKSLKLIEEDGKSISRSSERSIYKLKNRKRQLILLSQKEQEIKNKKIQKNLEAIKLLNHYSVSTKLSKQIIRDTVKVDIPLEEKPREEATVFTEEDFKKFEEEYAEA